MSHRFGATLTLAIVILSLSSPVCAADTPTVGAGYVPAETCGRCHRDHYATWAMSTHGKMNGRVYKDADRIGCESCHGPGKEHAESANKDLIINPARSLPEVAEPMCLKCHERGMRLYWRGSVHESRNITCTNCHTIHQHTVKPGGHESRFQERPLETRLLAKQTTMEVCFQCHPFRKAQMLRSSHMPMREGGVTCVDCHNPHGTASPGLLTENSVNETCYKCHPEKRGPFLWEHPPVLENCLNCHEPHGAMHGNLLKARVPRLCQRCHIPSGHPTQPGLARTRLLFNANCTNCHAEIHGSNHPSGVRFHR